MKFAISVHLSVIYASWKQEKRETEEKQYNHKMMNGHISKIARMLRRDVDVDQHILNISSNQLTFNRSLYCAGAPNENIVQNHLNIAMLNVF